MKWNDSNYPLVSPSPTDSVLIKRSSDGVIKGALISDLSRAVNRIGVAANIAALRAIPTDGLGDGAVTFLEGYYAAGDTGGGEFFYSIASGASDNGGTVIAPASGVGRWLRPESAVFNVVQFGARGNFDLATTAIQSTISAAEAYSQSRGDSGAVVYIPPGQYVLDDTLTISRIGITLKGASVASSGLFRSGDYGNTIEVNAQTGVVLSDFYCYTYSNTTTGAHIYLNGVTFCRLLNLFLRRQYGGINIIGGGCEIVDVICESGAAFTSNQAGSFGLKLEYNPTLSQAPSVNVVRFSMAAIADGGQVYPSTFFPPEYGIQILCADSAYFTACYSGNCRVNVHIKSINAYQNTDHAFSNCFFDGFFVGGPTEYGVLIEDDGTPATNFGLSRFDSCFFGGQSYRPGTTNTGRGLYSSSVYYRRMVIAGCNFESIGMEAIKVSGITNLSITGGTITNINKSGAVGIHAIELLGASISVAIDGISFGASTDSYVMHAAVSIAGTSDLVSVTGNTFFATDDNPVLVTTTGVQLMVSNNATQNNGDLASVAALAIPAHNDYFLVTGTTNITSMTGLWNKRKISLRFGGILTVTDGSNLKLNGDFVTAANAILTLVSDGSVWYEVARSQN